MRAIADTGFLVAFANRRDLHFRRAFAPAGQISELLLTCEAVLAETAFHLRDSALILRLLDAGMIRLAFVWKVIVRSLPSSQSDTPTASPTTRTFA